MKNTLPFLLLVLCLVGCGKSGPDTSSTSNSTNNSAAKAPSKPVKQLDVPSLIGKSKDEVKTIVGSEPKAEMPAELEWRITDKYDLDVNFDKGGKAKDVTYALPSGLNMGTKTAEEMATLAGIDLAGKKPDSDFESFTIYKGIPVSGGTAEAWFNKISETFRSVRLEVEKK